VDGLECEAMEIYLIVFAVMGVLILAMSIGVIFARKPISGSCGGMSALGMDVACDICKGDKSKCESEIESTASAAGGNTDLAYDAAARKK
jgi:hypothetical protein